MYSQNSRIFSGFAAPCNHTSSYWADLNVDASCGIIKVYDKSLSKWKRINTTTLENSDNAPQKYSNNAGHVKVNYTGLTIVGFESAIVKQFPLYQATAIVSPQPTTEWPNNSIAQYNGGMWIPGDNPINTGRLRENNVLGQVTRWRIIGTYTNKTIGNTTSLQIGLKNPDSGFYAVGKNYLPATVQDGDFAFEISTISDLASLDTGNGYIIDAKCSTTDPTLTISITSISRISEATEIVEIL